jgi:hypothetical protein
VVLVDAAATALDLLAAVSPVATAVSPVVEAGVAEHLERRLQQALVAQEAVALSS